MSTTFNDNDPFDESNQQRNSQQPQQGYNGQQPPQGYYAPPPPPKKKWYQKAGCIVPIVAIALMGGCTAIVFSGNGDDKPSTNSKPAKPGEPAKQGDKQQPAAPAMKTTSAQMIKDLESNALKAANKYKDKEAEITGYMGNVDAQGAYFSLDPSKDAMIITGVQVQLNDDLKNQVAEFDKGQKLLVKGKITNVGEVMGYSVDATSITKAK